MEMKEEVKELVKKVNKHEEDITALKIADAGITQQIKDLCKSVDGLVATLKWTTGVLVTITGILCSIKF